MTTNILSKFATNFIHLYKFSTKRFLATLSLGLFIVSGLSSLSVEAQNRPSPLSKDEISVAVNISGTFTVAFEYGSPNSTKNISQAIATATIINSVDASIDPSLEFVATETYKNYDTFDGDPSRAATDPSPRSAFPCSNFDGPKYEIPSSYFTARKMNNYGLQTAKTTAQNTAILTKGSSGCIVLQLKPTANAKVGDKAKIQFDWDSSSSPEFEASERPNLIIQPVTLIAGTASSSSRTSSSVRSVAPVSSSSSAPVVATPVARSGGISDGFILVGIFGTVFGITFILTKKREPKES